MAVTDAEIHNAIMRFYAQVCAENATFDTDFQTPYLKPPGHGLGIFRYDDLNAAWHCQMCNARVGFGHLTTKKHANQLWYKTLAKAGEFVNGLFGEQRAPQADPNVPRLQLTHEENRVLEVVQVPLTSVASACPAAPMEHTIAANGPANPQEQALLVWQQSSGVQPAASPVGHVMDACRSSAPCGAPAARLGTQYDFAASVAPISPATPAGPGMETPAAATQAPPATAPPAAAAQAPPQTHGLQAIQVTDSRDCPVGYKQWYDPNTGKCFYENTTTGQTMWSLE